MTERKYFTNIIDSMDWQTDFFYINAQSNVKVISG